MTAVDLRRLAGDDGAGGTPDDFAAGEPCLAVRCKRAAEKRA